VTKSFMWHLHTVPLVTYFYVHSIAPEYDIFLALLYLSSKSFLLSISLSTFSCPLQHLSSFSLQLSHLHLIYPSQKKIYDIEYKSQDLYSQITSLGLIRGIVITMWSLTLSLVFVSNRKNQYLVGVGAFQVRANVDYLCVWRVVSN